MELRIADAILARLAGDWGDLRERGRAPGFDPGTPCSSIRD